MNIPNRADWGDIDENDLDAMWALKQFLGKTFDEAEAMFQDNALYYQEDLQSMPSIPFNFYAPALAKYISSDRAEGDADGAASFLQLVAWMLKTQRNVMSKETEQLLVKVAGHVAENQPFYDADVDIYGAFSAVYAAIETYAKQIS